MGGEDSAVDDQTTDIFLESAFFRPEIIAGKARSYGLHTDSSHRFERGVDTGLQVRALERATELILQICGGEAGPVTSQAAASHNEEKNPIHLRTGQIKRILGIEMPVDQVTEIFQRLGMAVKVFPDGWLVKSPSFRFDIQLEADLLEELVRIYGYNNIPRTQPAYQSAIEASPEAENDLLRLKQALTDRGYYEAITYSFVDPEVQKVLAPGVEAIALANPLSSEMSVMRSTIWAGLLQALKYNVNRQQSRVRLFETGLCFTPGGDGAVAGITQVPMFSGVICGDIHDQQWSEKARRVDFFDLKADVEALLAFSGTQTMFEAAEHAALHPGQSACIRQDGEIVGWLGALHPNVQKSLDIDPAVFVFELKQSAVLSGTITAFQPLSRFPEVRRDLAVVVDEAVPVAAIMSVIDEVSSDLLKESRLFDVYQGQGVDEGRKSVAFGLILQEFSRTLTDHDVESEIENIVSALNQRFAATLRE
jgi:phenylalanyl-tRNA synthetase beta chain